MRLSLLFILPLLFTTWQTSFAATVDCSKIKTDAERLACFDNTSKPNEPPVSADAKGNEQKSKWEFHTEQSKMDDSTSYIIALFSDNQINEGEHGDEHGVILIGCKKLSTMVILSTGDLLETHGDVGSVRYRLDKEQAKTIEMKRDKSHRVIGLWSAEKSIPFIKEMFGRDKMLVELERYSGTTVTLEFSIKGIEEAIKPLRQECKW